MSFVGGIRALYMCTLHHVYSTYIHYLYVLHQVHSKQIISTPTGVLKSACILSQDLPLEGSWAEGDVMSRSPMPHAAMPSGRWYSQSNGPWITAFFFGREARRRTGRGSAKAGRGRERMKRVRAGRERDEERPRRDGTGGTGKSA